MMKNFLRSGVAALLLSVSAMAQSPVIVQPANQSTPAPQPSTQAQAGDGDMVATIKALEELKAANEELLKKQQATIQALDQLQKDADQLRIYAKRG